MKTIFLAVPLLILAACDPIPPDVSSTEQFAQKKTQERMVQNAPLPTLQYSAERANLIKRATRLNTENVNGCVTLISFGRVIAQYNVAGKVSSLNAYLTGNERLAYLSLHRGSTNYGGEYLVESPDVDGTYGENVDGVFFFEANTDAYVEWHGDFLFSDQCLTPNERPAMSRIVP